VGLDGDRRAQAACIESESNAGDVVDGSNCVSGGARRNEMVPRRIAPNARPAAIALPMRNDGNGILVGVVALAPST
jgi:hypothetical protein